METEKNIPDLPGSAADKIEEQQDQKISSDSAYIHNMMHNREWLTRQEAVILINNLSGSILIDETRRGESKKTDKKYL